MADRGEGGASYEDLVETEGRPRLRMWLDRVHTDGLLEAAVVYGYFPCYADGDDLVVVHHEGPSQGEERVRFAGTQSLFMSLGGVVFIGAGGVLAEIYKDFASRLAPVSEEAAAAMIEQVKGLAIIRGYRGMPKGDCTALAQTVSAFSQLAFIDSIAEAEINPLIVKREGEGVVAVDGLVVQR